MPGDSAIERAFYFLACGVARLVYRVKAIGIENLPSGGCLLVPNHITWVDAIILQLASPRAVRFIIDEEFYRKPALQPGRAPFRSTAVNHAKQFAGPVSRLKPGNSFAFSRKANSPVPARWRGYSVDSK